LDLLFRGASIVDGTGTPARIGDVGVRDGKIVLETGKEAKQTIDAGGLCLMPGIVVMLTNSAKISAPIRITNSMDVVRALSRSDA